jgi:phosphatidyl-myo-inositol alpha-mannosyltransferase
VRICLVSPYSWSFPGGVMEHIDSMVVHLERRGHEVEVLAPNDPLDLRTRLLHPKLGRHGPLPARVTPVGRSIPLPSNGSLANVAFSPTVYRAVRRAMRARPPEVVHVHEPLVPLASWAAMEVAGQMGIPIVGTFHANYPKGCAHYEVFKPVLAPYFGKLSARIAVSPTAAATSASCFPGEYRIIPNGVDVDRFRPTGAPRDPNRVLFVGRPVARKGLAVLLRALPALLEKAPDARLVIVGSAPEDVRMPKRLLSSVEFRGPVDGEALVSCMHSSSVLCAPSTGGESFGVVLVEAMAAGLPIVASEIPGYEAVVMPGKEGVLVPPRDVNALADALASLLRHPSRRAELSAAGRVSAERYDWPLIAAELEEIYLEVAGRS